MKRDEGSAPTDNYWMMRVPKVVLIWVAVFAFVTLAGGFSLGMYFGKGELKSPVSGVSYELAIVAKSGTGIGTRYYRFGKVYPNTEDLEKDLVSKKAVFENGAFRILERQEKKK